MLKFNHKSSPEGHHHSACTTHTTHLFLFPDNTSRTEIKLISHALFTVLVANVRIFLCNDYSTTVFIICIHFITDTSILHTMIHTPDNNNNISTYDRYSM